MNSSTLTRVTGWFSAALCCAGGLFCAEPATLLWQIGKADHKNAEFALAPDGYLRFSNDGHPPRA
jgi:hypothetical protein